MAHPPQQPDFDPNRQPPPQGPYGPPGGPTPPQPGYGPPPPGGVQPGYGPPSAYGPPPGYGGPPPMPPRRPRTGMVFGILIGSMALIIVVGLAIGKAGEGGGPSTSDSPEDVVEQYMDTMVSLLESGDFLDAEAYTDKLTPYFCSDIREEASADLEELGDEALAEQYSEEELALLEDMEVSLHYEITGSTVDGDIAIVDVEISAVTTVDGSDTESQDSSESFELIREDGTWLICDNFTDDGYEDDYW